MTIFIAAGVQLIGAILMSTSHSLGQFIVGRIFIGLGTGGLVATVPIWQSELSRAESRGGHVSSLEIYCGSGLSLALWVSYGLSFASGEVTWRLPISGSGVLSIIATAFIFTLPESPRW
jgi:MFS family permease